MELYNFFTEVVEADRLEDLKACYEELKEICVNVQLVSFNEKYFSIIGQIYGDDTNVGDTDLLVIFSGIKYSWFDAFCPSVNEIKK